MLCPGNTLTTSLYFLNSENHNQRSRAKISTIHDTFPLISIVVAVFNGITTLQQCIDSVAQQTYLNKELIIIDGGSNDGTVDVLKANQKKITYWISASDRGIYNAWNRGLEQTKGEWICFLGADDYFWDAQVLECMARHLGKMPASIRVAYGQVMLVNAHGESLYLVGEPWQKVRKRFKQLMCIPHTGVIHRRSLFELHGRFDESFHVAGDYELLLRELKSADASFVHDCIIAAMRVGGISSVPANSLLVLREIRRATRMHGQFLPGRFWTMAMASVYIRLMLWGVLGERLARKALDFGRRTIKGKAPFWTKT